MSVSHSARAGFGLIRFLASIVFLATFIAVGYGVYSNWDRDRDGDGEADGFTLHVFDPQWWSTAEDRARSDVAETKKRLLAEDGWIDEAKEWYQSQKQQLRSDAQAPEPDEQTAPVDQDAVEGSQGPVSSTPNAAPITPAASDRTDQDQLLAEDGTMPEQIDFKALPEVPTRPPDASVPTLHLEGRIEDSGKYFMLGMRAYRLAHESGTVVDAQRLADAETCFHKAQRLLDHSLEAYAQRPDHDPGLQLFGEGLRLRTETMLREGFDQP